LPQEVILVDDFSQDGTLDVLKSLKDVYDQLDIKVITLSSNRGAGAARNEGWEVASSEYVAFLDADDSWHPQKLQYQHGWMDKHPEAVFSGHTVVYSQDTAGEHAVLITGEQLQFRSISYGEILLTNKFLTPSVMIKRAVEHRFRCTRLCEDYMLWCELLASGSNGWWSPLPLAYIHKFFYAAGGLSSDLASMAKAERAMYRCLYREGNLSRMALIGCLIVNNLKVARRRAIAFSRKAR
jgi:glycosyltransferase involved in cell wall biosynthesis